jgi:hypothetical protein
MRESKKQEIEVSRSRLISQKRMERLRSPRCRLRSQMHKERRGRTRGQYFFVGPDPPRPAEPPIKPPPPPPPQTTSRCYHGKFVLGGKKHPLGCGSLNK